MRVLLEKSRNELIAKSKNEVPKGMQRYKRRLKSRVSSSTKEYNQINMNKFFKEDILDINIPVIGETDNYIVKISFGGVLDNLQGLLQNKDKVELRDIVRALINAFNKDNVYIGCTCPDNYYRFSYQQTKNKTSSTEPQLIPANITNPNDDLGSGCKHILLVLSNTSWIIKVASVITNYINYMERNRKSLYAKIIYPAIFNKAYEEPVQQSMFDDELEDNEETIDISNIEARKKGQFQKDNTYKYKPSETAKGQQSIEDIEGEENDDLR